jgi:hypothetical protein
MEVTGSGKLSKLLQNGKNYCCKNIYNTVPWGDPVCRLYFSPQLPLETLHFDWNGPGNQHRMGGLCRIDLFIRIACFVKKEIYILSIKIADLD